MIALVAIIAVIAAVGGTLVAAEHTGLFERMPGWLGFVLALVIGWTVAGAIAAIAWLA